MASRATSQYSAIGSAELTTDAPTRVVLAPIWPEIIILVIVLAFYLIAAVEAGPFMTVMNVAGPTMLMIALGYACIVMIGRDVVSIWTPLFWFRITFIAYCGVGSIVPMFVNEQTWEQLIGFFEFFPTDLVKYNIVSLIFFLAFLTGSQVALNAMNMSTRPKRRQEAGRRFIEPCGLDLRTMGLILFGVGFISSYVFVLPYQLGAVKGTQDQYFPQLALALQISFFLLTYWALREGSKAIYLIAFAVVVDSFFGLIIFSKSAALFPLIMAAIGAIYHKPRLIRVIVLAALLVGYYFTIVPVVSYSRNSLGDVYGSILEAPVSERLAIIADYTPREAESRNDGGQQGWARLSYVNAGSFAISEYDNGRPGNSLENAFTVFIPRALWPQKPSITQIGIDFNVAVNGNAFSQSSPGLPSDLYWSGGLAGVVIGGMFVGGLLCLWSLYSIAVMRTEAWHLLFLVLLGMRVGMSSDQFFVPAFLGPLNFAVFAHIALTLLNRLTLSRSNRRAAIA